MKIDKIAEDFEGAMDAKYKEYEEYVDQQIPSPSEGGE